MGINQLFVIETRIIWIHLQKELDDHLPVGKSLDLRKINEILWTKKKRKLPWLKKNIKKKTHKFFKK